MKHKETKFASTDVISSMPDNVVTNIMDRLPLQEAVRTSILARNWRLKWTMLSQLIFDDKFFEYLSDTSGENYFGRIISRLLFHLKGAIEKVVFCIGEYCCSTFDVEDHDISHWILFLSRNGIKDLTISLDGGPLVLPTHLFSCLDLKHLKLCRCALNPPTSFNGFPNLLSLDLDLMEISSIRKLINQCPLLEILNINSYTLISGKKTVLSEVNVTSEGNMNVVDIANLTNLKILSLPMRHLDRLTDCGSIFELVGCLPKLQELHLDFILCKKAAICSPGVDYNTTGILQLRRVVLTHLEGSENEVSLIKYLFACSPYLKKIVIQSKRRLESDEKFTFSTKLLKLHRASSVVDIDLR